MLSLFKQNSGLTEKLKSTAGEGVEATNWWKDPAWGVSTIVRGDSPSGLLSKVCRQLREGD